MFFVAIIAFICGLISIAFFENKWYNPVAIFSFFWGVIFFLYSIRLVPYYDVSDTAIAIFFLQTIAFAIGGILSRAFSIVLRKSSESSLSASPGEQIKYKLNYGVLYVFCAISIFLLLQGTVDVIKNLLNGMTFLEMVKSDLITENNATGIVVFLKIFVLFPTAYAISAITAIELMFKQGKKPWGLFTINIIIVVLYSLQHGARIMLVVFSVSYVFAYVLSRKIKSDNDFAQSKKMKRLVAVMCFISVVFSVFLSVSRGLHLDALGLSLYHYLAACVPNLDYWVDNLSQNTSFTFGFSSLYGFLSPLVILLNGLGLINGSPSLYRLAGKYVFLPEEVSFVGKDIKFNAFISHSYVFYVDFGLVGVIIGNLVYGYIISNIFNILHRKNDQRLASVCVLLFSTLCLSFIRFAFCQYHYAMALILCFLVYRRERNSL